MKLSEADSILFSVFDDPEKVYRAKYTVRRINILNYSYEQRIGRLNELLTGIEQLKNIDKPN